jgi:hypothetical protein
VQHTGITNTDSLNSFITKTIQFIAMQIQKSFPGVPIYPVLGNNDDFCGDYMIQQNDPFLPVFAKAWAASIDSVKGVNTFSQTVPTGGYYMTSLPGYPDHVIIGLNSIFFSPKDTSKCLAVDTSEGQNEINWLAKTLASCKQQNKKVWFTCHIPPGADVYSSLKHQGDPAKCLEHIKMMWKNEYLSQFLALENQYKDIITGGLAGHTHMDDFRVISDPAQAPISFFHICPSISPIDGNNPSYVLFTYDPATMIMQDYTKYVFQGLQSGATDTWTLSYDFDKTYHVTQLTGQSMAGAWSAMNTDTTMRGNYLLNYGGGKTSVTPTVWKPYICGIGDLPQLSFGSCACDTTLMKKKK